MLNSAGPRPLHETSLYSSQELHQALLRCPAQRINNMQVADVQLRRVGEPVEIAHEILTQIRHLPRNRSPEPILAVIPVRVRAAAGSVQQHPRAATFVGLPRKSGA